jgi:hypothetical protein
MPDLEAVIRGEEVSIPADIDLQYAIATSLVGKAIRAKETPEARRVHGHILSFAKRLRPREIGVMLVSDMQHTVGQEIFNVPEFAHWANAVADVMLYQH